MAQEELFRRLAVVLAIGLLIGLEQGWRTREEAEGERTAGLRTHALSGLKLCFSNGPGDVKSPGAAYSRFSKCRRS